MRVLLPWDKLFLYDLRLQTHDDTYNAISKDGVNLTGGFFQYLIPTASDVPDIEPIVRISDELGMRIEVATFIGSSPIRQYAEGWPLE